MSLLEKINHVRSQPEDYRRRVTFWLSAGFTALVAAFWVASLSFTMNTSSSSQVAAVASSDKEEVATDSTSSPQATSAPAGNGFVNDNKTKIIEGWKVITNRN